METKEDTYHHKDLRNILIETGIAIVAEEGLEGFSLRKVAAACNVSHAAPYSHFKNKEQLLEEMQQYITDQFSLQLQNTLDSCTKPAHALEALGESYLDFFLTHRTYFTFLFSQSTIRLNLTDHADSTDNYKPYEIFRHLVLQLLQENNYPKAKQNDAVIALWAFIHGVTSLATMNNIVYDQDWKKKLHDFMRVFDCSALSLQK
jgi:AcrR family transcriptional regulator